MKNEKLDFDEIKKGMNEFKSHPITKLAVGTVAMVVIIYGAGKLMKLLATSVSEYKTLKRSLNEPTSPPKNPT